MCEDWLKRPGKILAAIGIVVIVLSALYLYALTNRMSSKLIIIGVILLIFGVLIDSAKAKPVKNKPARKKTAARRKKRRR